MPVFELGIFQNENLWKFKVTNSSVISGSFREVFLMETLPNNDKWLLKKPKNGKYKTTDMVINDFKTQILASQMCKEFNKQLQTKKTNLPNDK